MNHANTARRTGAAGELDDLNGHLLELSVAALGFVARDRIDAQCRQWLSAYHGSCTTGIGPPRDRWRPSLP